MVLLSTAPVRTNPLAICGSSIISRHFIRHRLPVLPRRANVSSLSAVYNLSRISDLHSFHSPFNMAQRRPFSEQKGQHSANGHDDGHDYGHSHSLFGGHSHDEGHNHDAERIMSALEGKSVYYCRCLANSKSNTRLQWTRAAK